MKTSPPLRARLLAEAVGTFILVFCGTGAIVFNQLTDGGVSHVGIALTFGLVVLAVIYTIGDVSGAHINPAVTIGFTVAGRCPVHEVVPYLGAQAIGALLASGVLWSLFAAPPTLREERTFDAVKTGAWQTSVVAQPAHGFGVTRPWGRREPDATQIRQAFWLELILTAILMLAVLSVSHGPHEKGITAGIVVGAVIALEALFAGPISGASMNPIRTLAPAAFSGELTQGWLWLCYVVAPIAGALIAVPLFQIIHQPQKE